MPYIPPTPQPTAFDHQMETRKRRILAATTSRSAVQTVTNQEASDFEGSWPTNFTKGLPHDDFGVVKPGQFPAFLEAINPPPAQLQAGAFAPVPGPDGAGFYTRLTETQDFAPRGWESPLAGHQHDLQGPAASAVAMAPAPRLGSDELAAEMAEVYALALLRDTSFKDIRAQTEKVQARLDDLNALPWFSGAPDSTVSLQSIKRRDARRGHQTGQNVFRGSSPGCDEGPYISQFLLQGHDAIALEKAPKDRAEGFAPELCVRPDGSKACAEDGYIAYGVNRIDQRVSAQLPEHDYMTTWAEWLDVQNGADASATQAFQANAPKFIETPRDLASYVHYDQLYQAYLNAALLLLGWNADFDRGLPEPNARDEGEIATRRAFATWGGPHLLTLVTESATRSLKAVRRQKFNFHCRARPEALGGVATLCANGEAARLGAAQDLANLHLEKLRSAGGLMAAVHDHNTGQGARHHQHSAPSWTPAGENLLLPMAFPEGSPMHPSYGAGHATVAGSCVTILKAFFEMCDKSGALLQIKDLSSKSNLEPAPGGQTLVETADDHLTLEGELNKLAANIAIGRNMAGVHYYSDYYDSLRMGERVGVGILLEQMRTYVEPVCMQLRSFDEQNLVISTTGVGDALLTVDGGSDDLWWRAHLPHEAPTIV